MHRHKPNRVKLSVLDTFKKQGRISKLRAEILLLERELTNLQYAFGIEYYNELTDELNGNNKSVPEVIASLYSVTVAQINAQLETYEAKKIEMDFLQLEKAQLPPANTMSEKAKNAAIFASKTATLSKVQLEMQYIQHQIKSLKQTFGTQVFQYELDNSPTQADFRERAQHVLEQKQAKLEEIDQLNE